MAARIGQLRLAGIGTGGTITAPARAPSVGQQLAATGDVLTALAAGLTDDLTALDKLKSVEIEERFKRNVDERNAKINPLDADFEEQVSNVVEEERAAATETANDTFGTQSELDALQLLLKTQGEGLKTLASTFRRSAISKEGMRMYEEASDGVLAQVAADPDGADLYVDAFKEKVKRLGAGVPPLTLAKMALEFADDAIFAQVEGLALQRRFEEARALADDEAGEFPPERFRTLKRRVREIEANARADDLAANADEVADIDIAEQVARLIGHVGLHAEDQLGHVLEDQEDGIGDQHHDHLVAPVHPFEQAALDDDSEHQADGDGGKQQQRVGAVFRIAAAQVFADRPGGGEGAKRVKAAMRDVEDVHHPVDQGEAHRHQEQPRRIGNAIDQDDRRIDHRPSAAQGLSRIRRPGSRPGSIRRP